MLEGIPIPVGALAPSAIAGLAVLLVLLGRLKPRKDFEDLIHDRDQWRAESRLRDQHIVELTEQNTILLREIAPTMNSFLASLRQAADEAKAGGES